MHSPLFIVLGAQVCVFLILIFLVWFLNVHLRQAIRYAFMRDRSMSEEKYLTMTECISWSVIFVCFVLGADLAMAGITTYRIWFMH